MEEKKKKLADDTAPSGVDQGWSGLFWLSLFVLLEAAALCSVTIWQQNMMAHYSARIDSGSRLLAELEETCVPVDDVNGSTHTNSAYGKREARQQDDVIRKKRQTLSNLFHDLLQAQEQILLEVCVRRTDLCKAGPKGEKGDQGDKGIRGVNGPKGDVGATGPHGDKGQPGPTGVTGGVGPLGPKGIRGDPGVQGAKGATGVPGDKGVRGDTGPTGADGKDGARGEKGDKGPAGSRGPPGAKGDAGPAGARGDAGPRGPHGDAGTPGPKGELIENGCLCYELPKVTGNFSDTAKVRLHHKLVLHCDVNDPESKITWRRADGRNIPSNVRVSGNDLIIESATEANKGEYQCVASSKTGNVIKSVDIQLIEPSKNDCDFESKTFCQWTNTRDDRFDWMLTQGSTPTANTGPTADHTRGDAQGTYAFIETSSPRVNNDNARLESPALLPSKPYCLDFWYHLFGHSLGNINVRIKENGIVGQPIWTWSGPSADAWHNAKINIPPQPTPFSLIIEGVRGDNYYGDGAIDDLTLSQARCS